MPLSWATMSILSYPTSAQVLPVTMIASKASPGHNKTIAVNEAYIAYGLPAGHVRVIHRSGARALLRGPKQLLCDIRCVVDVRGGA